MKQIAKHNKIQIEPLKEILTDNDLFNHLRSTGSIETLVANILNLKISILPAHPFEEKPVIDVIFFGTAGQVISQPFVLHNSGSGIEISPLALKPEHEIIDVNRLAFRCKDKEFEASIVVYDISKSEDPEVIEKEQR